MGYFKTEFCVSHIRYILLYYIVYKNATKIIRKIPKFVLFFSKNNAPPTAVRYILCRLHGNSIYFITKCVLVKIFFVIYSKYSVSFHLSVTHPRTQTRITLPITSFKCGAQQKTSGIYAIAVPMKQIGKIRPYTINKNVILSDSEESPYLIKPGDSSELKLLRMTHLINIMQTASLPSPLLRNKPAKSVHIQ